MKIETFLEQHLNLELNKYQMKMMSLMVDPDVKRLAIRWGRSVGKSSVAAALKAFREYERGEGAWSGCKQEYFPRPFSVIIDEWAEYERSQIREHTPRPRGSYMWEMPDVKKYQGFRVVEWRPEKEHPLLPREWIAKVKLEDIKKEDKLRGLFTDACYFF